MVGHRTGKGHENPRRKPRFAPRASSGGGLPTRRLDARAGRRGGETSHHSAPCLRKTSVTRSDQSWSDEAADLAVLTLDHGKDDQIARRVGLDQFDFGVTVF